MKTILIPVSKDTPLENLKDFILLMANKSIYKLHLIHVLTSVSVKDYQDAVETNSMDELNQEDPEEKKILQNLNDELIANGYLVETTSSPGLFQQKLTSLIDEINPAFVIMLTKGSNNLHEDLFGTNTLFVLKKIRVPIFILPHDYKPRKFDRAVIGMDLETDQLNAAKDLFDFSDETGIETVLVKIDDAFQIAMIDDEEILTALQKMYPDRVDHIIHRKHESIAEGLEDFVVESDSDLIVLFTTKRNFVTELFHKSVTSELTLYSKKPLLIYHY